MISLRQKSLRIIPRHPPKALRFFNEALVGAADMKWGGKTPYKQKGLEKERGGGLIRDCFRKNGGTFETVLSIIKRLRSAGRLRCRIRAPHEAG